MPKNLYVLRVEAQKSGRIVSVTLNNVFTELGGIELILTSREPLIERKTLFKNIETARNKGIREVVVTTNGTLLLDQDIGSFNEHAVKVVVRSDHGTPFTNDHFRGKELINYNEKFLQKLIL